MNHPENDYEWLEAFDSPEIAEIRDQIFKRVNRDQSHSQPMFDNPSDRVLGVEVRDVYDLVEHLTLMDVFAIVQQTIHRG